jgi:hypothetical protein
MQSGGMILILQFGQLVAMCSTQSTHDFRIFFEVILPLLANFIFGSSFVSSLNKEYVQPHLLHWHLEFKLIKNNLLLIYLK